MSDLQIKQLTKRFGARTAVRDLNLEVRSGTIFGLLGHNGAGKSTTIGMLLGHLAPDAGETRIGGISVQENRAAAIREVGAMFEAPAFYPYLSGRRNLEIFGAYSGNIGSRELEEVIALVGLERRIGDKVARYSHGMRQRLAIAQALLPAPSVLILDEPTDGLDPEGIREMRMLVQRLHRERGLTILLSSHLLGEVEQLCDRIGILSEGDLLYSGDWRKELELERHVRLEVDDPASCRQLLAERKLTVETEREAGTGEPVDGTTGGRGVLEIELAAGAAPADCVDFLVGCGIRVHGCGRPVATLEAFYLSVLRGRRTEGRSA